MTEGDPVLPAFTLVIRHLAGHKAAQPLGQVVAGLPVDHGRSSPDFLVFSQKSVSVALF